MGEREHWKWQPMTHCKLPLTMKTPAWNFKPFIPPGSQETEPTSPENNIWMPLKSHSGKNHQKVYFTGIAKSLGTHENQGSGSYQPTCLFEDQRGGVINLKSQKVCDKSVS